MVKINMFMPFISVANRDNMVAESNQVREAALNWQKENEQEIMVIGSKASYQALSEDVGVFTIIVEYQTQSGQPFHFIAL